MAARCGAIEARMTSFGHYPARERRPMAPGTWFNGILWDVGGGGFSPRLSLSRAFHAL